MMEAKFGNYEHFKPTEKLIPVGLDVDGTIKPIDELSYKPLEGWKLTDPEKWTIVSGGDED